MQFFPLTLPVYHGMDSIGYFGRLLLFYRLQLFILVVSLLFNDSLMNYCVRRHLRLWVQIYGLSLN